MRKISLVLFIFTLCLTVSAQKKASDRERRGLIGPVKSVAYKDVSLSQSEESNAEQKCGFCFEEYFDKDGNLTENLWLGLNFKWTKKIIDGFETYKASEIVEKPKEKYNGFISSPIPVEKNIEEPEILFPPDERYNQKIVYEYDSLGRTKVERDFQNNGRLLRKLTYTYDDKNRIVEEIVETRSDKDHSVYKYDDKGNVLQQLNKSYSRVGGKDYETKYVYSDYKFDSQGNWTQRKEIVTYQSWNKPFITETLVMRTIVYF